MANLKVTYFDMRGRGEPLRLACEVGGLEWEDDRIKPSDFGELRPKLPYLALPTMEIDGQVYAQSMALLRYIGKQTKLYPDCALEALKVDEALDVMVDLQAKIFGYRGDDKELLREQRVKLAEEDIPRYMGGLEKRLETIGGDGPYLFGSDVTIADIAFIPLVITFRCGLLEFVGKDALDGFPRLMKSYDATMSHPKIAEWYKKHPVPNM